MQSLTGADVLTILGRLLLYDVLKWYYYTLKKESEKRRNDKKQKGL